MRALRFSPPASCSLVTGKEIRLCVAEAELRVAAGVAAAWVPGSAAGGAVAWEAEGERRGSPPALAGSSGSVEDPRPARSPPCTVRVCYGGGVRQGRGWRMFWRGQTSTAASWWLLVPASSAPPALADSSESHVQTLVRGKESAPLGRKLVDQVAVQHQVDAGATGQRPIFEHQDSGGDPDGREIERLKVQLDPCHTQSLVMDLLSLEAAPVVATVGFAEFVDVAG